MAMITIHRDLGVTAITALWDSIDLLLDPLLGSVDSSLKPAFLPVHHVDHVCGRAVSGDKDVHGWVIQVSPNENTEAR